MRHIETINAMKNLGLNESNIIFLSYPDGGMRELFLDHWDYNNLFKMSKGSNQFDHSHYSFSYEKNAPYCGANVVKNIEQIMTGFKPNKIFIPDDGDDHPDHWATSAFVGYAVIEKNYTGNIFTYLVHKGSNWPIPLFYSPNSSLLPPEEIYELDGEWMKLDLNSDDEKLKEAAIRSHATQIFEIKNLLESFIRKNEVFSIYPLIDIREQDSTDFINQGMPESSFKDLKNDPATQKLEQADDLTSAGMAYDKNNFYLLLKSKRYSPNLFYDFNIFTFDGNQFKRIDVEVNGNNARFLSKSQNSVISNQNPTVETGNDTIVVKLPISLFKGTKYILMTAQVKSRPTDKPMDTVASRTFVFNN